MCQFEWLELGRKFRCSRCGMTDTCSNPAMQLHRIHMVCKVGNAGYKPAPKGPPLYKRLANFTVAAIGHVMAGMPTCTQEQIDERLAVCQDCELFKPSKADPQKGVCTHSTCGCSLGREGKFISKLGWSDSSCPLEKWPALSTPATPSPK